MTTTEAPACEHCRQTCHALWDFPPFRYAAETIRLCWPCRRRVLQRQNLLHYAALPCANDLRAFKQFIAKRSPCEGCGTKDSVRAYIKSFTPLTLTTLCRRCRRMARA